MINCPECGNPTSRVYDKRNKKGYFRRRRKCEACQARYTTVEIHVPKDARLVFRKGRKHALVRDN